MVRAKLSLDGPAVVPDRPYLGAAVVVLVADPAAAAVVVLVADDQALVILVLVVIASHDLAAGCPFGRKADLCANHRSLPSWIAGELRAAGRRLAGRRSRCACAAAFLHRDHVQLLAVRLPASHSIMIEGRPHVRFRWLTLTPAQPRRAGVIKAVDRGRT